MSDLGNIFTSVSSSIEDVFNCTSLTNPLLYRQTEREDFVEFILNIYLAKIMRQFMFAIEVS